MVCPACVTAALVANAPAIAAAASGAVAAKLAYDKRPHISRTSAALLQRAGGGGGAAARQQVSRVVEPPAVAAASIDE